MFEALKEKRISWGKAIGAGIENSLSQMTLGI